MASEKFSTKNGAMVDMKIRSDGVNVLAKAFDANGKEMNLPNQIVFYPQFFKPCEQVRLATIDIMSLRDGDSSGVYRATMDISGRSGAIRMEKAEEIDAVLPFFITGPKIKPVDTEE